MGQRNSKENQAPQKEKFLVYGKTGWIGGLVGQLLTEQGIDWEYGNARLEDRQAIMKDIRRVRLLYLHSGTVIERLKSWSGIVGGC